MSEDQETIPADAMTSREDIDVTELHLEGDNNTIDTQTPETMVRKASQGSDHEEERDSASTGEEEVPEGEVPKVEAQQIEPSSDLQTKQERVPNPQSKESIQKSSTGPYSLITLIETIPTVGQGSEEEDEVIPTSIESWELNIYVGTSKGELLHFFKLDDEFGYMLISRQKISQKGSRAVKKIILLPDISRALILCNSSISCFMMPEMSPASIGKIKDVRDISLDIKSYKLDQKNSNKVIKASAKTQGITAVVFTSKAIRFILITPDTIKLVKDLSYPNIETGVRCSQLAFIGTASSYDLLNLETGKKTQLFPISSDSDSNLHPIIVPITTDEFLMSCGTKLDESSIGMVVNTKADISRGTISWIKYPTSAISDYPHVIASFGSQIQVHSIQDQELLQTFEFEREVKVSTVSHIFNRKFDEIVDIIRLVPLVDNQNVDQVRIEEELQIASKFATVTSSSIIFSAEEGIKLLVSTPMLKRILQLSNGDHLESVFDDMEDEIKALDKTTDYGVIQYNFSKLTSCITLLKHFQFDRAFDYYIDNKLDLRVAIFLFAQDFDLLYGDIWVYKGLKPKLEALRDKFQTVLLNEKPNDDEAVLRFAMDEFYRLLMKKYFSTNDVEMDSQARKSVQVVHFLNECATTIFNSIEDIGKFVESIDVKFSSTEIVGQLKKRNMLVILAAFLKSMGKHEDALNLFVGLGKGNLQDPLFKTIFKSDRELYQYILDYAVENISDEGLLWEIGLWLLEKDPEYGVKLFSSPLLKADISELRVIQMLNDKNLGKLTASYLEVLLLDRNEIQFIADLIYEISSNLVKELQEDSSILQLLNESVETYQKMESPKLSFAKFISVEFRRFPEKKFCRLHNQLFNYILISTKDATTITRESNVTISKYCKQLFKPYENQLPYMMSLLEFKDGDFAKCVERLCSLTDYKTAEYVATRLTIPFNLANFDEKVDKFINIHRWKVNTQTLEDIEDEDATIAVRSIATVSEGSDTLTQELLLQIFENYLQLNNFKLIESFLDAHHLFDIASQEGDDLDQTFEMFEMVLTKLPPSFPVVLINRFLSTSLIKLGDAEQNKNKHKNLEKAVNKKLKVLLRELTE